MASNQGPPGEQALCQLRYRGRKNWRLAIDTERPTRRVEAGCSCSAELAWRSGLDGPIRTDAGFRRLGCNQMPSAAWLRRDVWHRTTASNREPSALEAAALPVELARCGGCGRIRTNVSSRETALQAARNRPRCHAPFDWRLVHDSNVRPPASQTGALDPAELTRHLPGAERGLRSPAARAFNAPLNRLSYLGKLWRPVRESNPRLPTRQAGTLAAELTRRGGGERVRTFSLPLAGCCSAVCWAAPSIWRRVRDSNPRSHLELMSQEVV